MAIKQRISLEGSDDIKQKLEQLGKTGEQAFKQIQGASEAASASMGRFRLATVGVVAAVTAVAAAISALTKGAGETAKELSEQADALGLTAKQWIELRRSVDAAGGSVDEFANSTKPLLQQLGKMDAELSGKSIQTFADGVSVTINQLQGLQKEGASQESFWAKQKILWEQQLGVVRAQGPAFQQVATQAQQLQKVLEKFGVRRDIIDKGSVAIMNELARIIDGMPEGTAKATAGLQFFGEKWRNVVDALTIGRKSIGDVEAEMDNARRASRQMTEDQVKGAKQAADQWEDLGKAIRAAKDQIGALFSAGSFANAKWLTDLVDDSRMLLRTWSQLGEAKKQGFLAGLGDSPAETAFKTLVAVGDTLAGIWRDILVPAGNKLVEIFGQISGSLEGVTKAQVTGFFIAAAAAAVALSIALKGIALVLAPLGLVLSLFSPFGAVLIAAAAAAALFWDELKLGAEKVAQLIPQQLQDMTNSFKKLFAGDFAGFWTEFSTAALSAFEAIKQALSQMVSETPWMQTLIDGFKQIAQDAPGAIVLVVQALSLLGTAATTVAETINKIFGTELTGTGVALLTIIASLTGGLVALAAVAGTVASVATVFGILGTAIGGIPATIIAIGTAIVGAIAWWLRFSEAGQAAVTAVNEFATNFIGMTNQIGTAIGAIWDRFVSAGTAAINGIMSSIDSLISKIVGVGSAIAGIFRGGGAPGDVGPIPGNAAGGLIGGRGSGTSDSNLAWVSRGEHIMPARAVRQPGVLAFLEALRRGNGNLRGVMNGMGRYAAGGLVPRFAEGGLVGGMQHLGTVDLRTDHGTARLMASSSAVEQLTRLAVTKRMTSTGKKPGFIG